MKCVTISQSSAMCWHKTEAKPSGLPAPHQLPAGVRGHDGSMRPGVEPRLARRLRKGGHGA